MTTPFRPRLSQRRILGYARGMLGISAVPGSGKTHTLSALASKLLQSARLDRGQEILIVTLVNSAVQNFAARIASFGQAESLISQLKYRVRTLHGLCHDIVREDPPLVGLDKKFSIVDDVASAAMIREAARSWVHLHSEVRAAYIKEGLNEARSRQLENRLWPELVETVAASFIKSAKNRRQGPESLRRMLEHHPAPLPLAQMGAEIYAAYQGALAYRGAVDFDDLIRFAADMLDASPELLERLRYRWPYILEDEAQDSSRLQEYILSTLAGTGGNWVRVGDPNQAIYETFTTADPELLRTFIAEHDSVPMPESGRCQPSVMDLANFLVEWTMNEHPAAEIRDALSEPFIEPSPPGDPQSNPPDNPRGIFLDSQRRAPEEEIRLVARSLQQWLPAHQDATVAVLCATNVHATKMVQALQARGIPYRELLQSTSPTREVANALGRILGYLSDPGSSNQLAQAYSAWRHAWRNDKEREVLSTRTAAALTKLREVENYAAASASAVALERIGLALPQDLPTPDGLSAEDIARVRAELEEFQPVLARWLAGTVLPVDQLILALAQEIFTEPAELALAHKLALLLRQLAEQNPFWRLPELAPHLNNIARNERKFLGFSDDDAGFDPDSHKGVVVVATMHKAKGLEWDRVHLMSVNDYDFPAAQPGDRYYSEKWFLRDELNLEAETLAQLDALLSQSEYAYYEEGGPTRRARLDYSRERLRLLYVGITRAKRELIVTWNTGRRGDAGPALALVALQAWWASRS